MPTVSVVMATYNRSELLPYSIGSVMRQGLPRWELIVASDGCTDDTAQVVGNLATIDPHSLRPPHAALRRAGRDEQSWRRADARVLHRLPQHDDLWLGDHLERGVEAIERLVPT